MRRRTAREREKDVEDSPGLDPVVSQSIIALTLTASALVILLSFFDKAGVFGTMIDDYILSFLFGSIRFAVPIALLLIAYAKVRGEDITKGWVQTVGVLLFFVSLGGLFHMHFATDAMWAETLLGNGGGLLGMSAWPAKTYLGPLAGTLVLLAVFGISVMLAFHEALIYIISLNEELISSIHAVSGRIRDAYQKAVYRAPREENTDDQTDDEDIEEEEEEVIIHRPNIDGRRAEIENDDDETETSEENEYAENAEKEKTKNSVASDTQKPPTPTIDQAAYLRNVIIKKIPPTTLLSTKRGKPTSGDIDANAKIIHDTLSEFGIDTDMGEVRVGPTVTQYTLKPSSGVKLSRITSLSNNLSLNLAAHPIRIEAPIPGKSLVGVEVPNEKAAQVSLLELLEAKEFIERPHNMMIALGKDVAGKVWFADLPRMPHLLVAGATGSGKTVCVNAIIMSLLYQNTAETLRFIMVDPKRVELTLYNGIPHLLTPVITNTAKTINALKWTIQEMDRRFEVLSQAGNRDIKSYNSSHPKSQLPHIVFIIDELADLMQTAAHDVEAGIIRLAQMARAVGIHLVLATQRPSVDVITGLMKANIPGRIAFSVASITDSRTILDEPGAERLLGRGDMLLSTAELSKPVRIQGAYISEDEVKRVIEYLHGDDEPVYDESIVERSTGNGTQNMFGGSSDSEDPLFHEAKQAVIEAGKASASFLQRRFKVGYARAARILDELEAAGVIGPGDGAKPRDILMTSADSSATVQARPGTPTVFSSVPTAPERQKVATIESADEEDKENQEEDQTEPEEQIAKEEESENTPDDEEDFIDDESEDAEEEIESEEKNV